MNDIKKVERFNYFEKLFFKVTLGILGLSIFLFFFMLATVEYFSSFGRALFDFTGIVLFATMANFVLSLVRLFKYAFSIGKLENNIGITRTIISLFLSPVAFIILYILVIIMAFASCTVQ